MLQAAGDRIVGRDGELRRLLDLLDAAAAGRPMHALISGDAGVGKTRLVTELAVRAADRGFTVLAGRCAELGDSIPYLPLADALRNATTGPDPAQALLDAVASRPLLDRLLPDRGASPPPADLPGLAQQQLFGAVLGMLAELASLRPVLLVLEDVQLPKDAILPKSGGLKSPLMCLTQARYGIAWGAVGAAMACFDEAVSYAKPRVMFGKPIGRFQLQQQRLAEALTEITKAQLLCIQLGRLKDQGTATPEQVSLAKRNNVSMAADIAREARRLLDARAMYYAELLGVKPSRITVRDTSSRWGSCSSTRNLSFSWRLILAPPFVLEYVVAHEVAHLREMNHGPRFWRLVEDLVGNVERPQAWLNENAALLHRYAPKTVME